MVKTVIISGLTNEWNALNHLQTWVSKNAKSYLGSDKYLKAEGCVRDELVTLGSVKLGSIEGTVSDGSGASCAVTLARHAGSLTSTCTCGTVCHHIAAFLLHISKANRKETSPFDSGDTCTNFSYMGYLASSLSQVELVELCAKYVPVELQNEARLKVGITSQGTVSNKLLELGSTIGKALRHIDTRDEDPFDISNALAAPMDELVPFYKTHPEGVLMILKSIFTFQCTADLEVYYEDPLEEVSDSDEPRGFDSCTVTNHSINFILAQPENKRGDVLVELFSPYTKTTKRLSSGSHLCFVWVDSLCERDDSAIGENLIQFLISPAFIKRISSKDHIPTLLKRFAKHIPITTRIATLKPVAETDDGKAVELMKLYIEQKEERKAILWLDSRLIASSLPKPRGWSAYSNSNDLTELLFIRAKLAVDVERDGNTELMWLKVVMQVGGHSVFQRVCKLRPDHVSEFEVLFSQVNPASFAAFLYSSKRSSDLIKFLSTGNNLEMSNSHTFNVVDYLSHHPRGVANAESYLKTLLDAEIKIPNDYSYKTCVKILKTLRKVSPKTGDIEIGKIRKKYKIRRNLMRLMDEAKFA